MTYLPHVVLQDPGHHAAADRIAASLITVHRGLCEVDGEGRVWCIHCDAPAGACTLTGGPRPCEGETTVAELLLEARSAPIIRPTVGGQR